MNTSFLQEGIVFGLLSIFSWGIGDYFYALASRKYGVLSAALFTAGGATVMFFVFAVMSRTSFMVSPSVALAAASVGVVHILADLLYAKGLTRGKVSLVTPIMASYSTLLVVAAVIFLGERITFIQIVAICIVIIGTIMASTDLKELSESQKFIFNDHGVPYAFSALSLYAIGFFVLKLSIQEGMWINANLIMYVIKTTIVLLVIAGRKQSINYPSTPSMIVMTIMLGIFAGGGYIGYSIGIWQSIGIEFE